MEEIKLIKLSNGNFEDLVEEDIQEVITGRAKKKPIPWTEDEQRLFLRGLEEEGKGEWKAISRKYLPNKTPTQIASHAQKFYKRKNSKTPLEKRRSSINDIELDYEPDFSLNSQNCQPIQPDFLMDSQNFQPNPFISPSYQEGLPSSDFNFSLSTFQNSQLSQLNFPLDSHNFQTSHQFGNVTNYNHVHNNYY
ncbi:hypothetical protein POM88_005047 [Heracleum sosnowskyi]|uniref:Uncharacterized protein n=1 Tax=Heracleum sosnowskyi TaxID=360622 RepID=A0AAD8JJ66_9APIA|nr:hypothetical protein POM88_005047 [Heracleum sosnowskyi]